MKRPSTTSQFSFDIRAAAVVGSRHIFRGASASRCGAAPKGVALAFFGGLAHFRHLEGGSLPYGKIPLCAICPAKAGMLGTAVPLLPTLAA
jgi:hypothetical protein